MARESSGVEENRRGRGWVGGRRWGLDVRRFGFQSWDDGTRLYRASRGPAILPHPLLQLGAMSVLVVLVQTNPTQPNGLSLLRLHLRVSTNRPSPSSSTSTFSSFSSSSSTSSYFSSSGSFATLGLPPTATYRRTLFLLHPLLLVLMPPSFAPSPPPPNPPATTFSTSADTLTRTQNFVVCRPVLLLLLFLLGVPHDSRGASRSRPIPKNLNVSGPFTIATPIPLNAPRIFVLLANSALPNLGPLDWLELGFGYLLGIIAIRPIIYRLPRISALQISSHCRDYSGPIVVN